MYCGLVQWLGNVECIQLLLDVKNYILKHSHGRAVARTKNLFRYMRIYLTGHAGLDLSIQEQGYGQVRHSHPRHPSNPPWKNLRRAGQMLGLSNIIIHIVMHKGRFEPVNADPLRGAGNWDLIGFWEAAENLEGATVECLKRSAVRVYAYISCKLWFLKCVYWVLITWSSDESIGW